MANTVLKKIETMLLPELYAEIKELVGKHAPASWKKRYLKLYEKAYSGGPKDRKSDGWWKDELDKWRSEAYPEGCFTEDVPFLKDEPKQGTTSRQAQMLVIGDSFVIQLTERQFDLLVRAWPNDAVAVEIKVDKNGDRPYKARYDRDGQGSTVIDLTDPIPLTSWE